MNYEKALKTCNMCHSSSLMALIADPHHILAKTCIIQPKFLKPQTVKINGVDLLTLMKYFLEKKIGSWLSC